MITIISRESALSSKDEEEDATDGVYNKLVDSLDSLKGKIQEKNFQPKVKENLFFILMSKLTGKLRLNFQPPFLAIFCFLLLTAVYAANTEEVNLYRTVQYYTILFTSIYRLTNTCWWVSRMVRMPRIWRMQVRLHILSFLFNHNISKMN